MTGTAVFLDTSIQIALVIHGKETKDRISARLRQYDLTVSSAVVRLEFKRRLLNEASYLLRELNKRKSFHALHRHVLDALSHPRQQRKRNICLDTLATIHEGSSDEDLTERARRSLRVLLLHGLKEFDDRTGHVVHGAGCVGLRCLITEKRKYELYDLGVDKCSKAGSACGVVQFLKDNNTLLHTILDYLRNKPVALKSREIQNAEGFLEAVTAEPHSAQDLDPCSRVGDLMIALESSGIPVFYTMNGKESQHFCDCFNQDMVLCHPNADRDERVYARGDRPWPQI